MIVDVYKGDIYIYYIIFIYIVNPVKLCDTNIQTLQFFFGFPKNLGLIASFQGWKPGIQPPGTPPR